MKKMNPVHLAVVFSGCLLGAGYVSGQELWQFFGSYGKNGYWGLLAAIGLLFCISLLTLRLAQLSGVVQIDKILIPWNVPALRMLVGVQEVIQYFGVVAVMTAGVGALLETMCGLPAAIGCIIFSVLVLALALMGLSGVVSAFSISVPILVVTTVAFGIASLAKGDFFTQPWESASGTNPLLGNWLLGALTFTSYNAFGTVGILAPFGGYVKKKKTLYAGLGLGAMALLLVALSVMVCLRVWPAAASEELPMLAVAADFGAGYAWVYALLLIAAMFGTALSCLVGIVDYLERKYPILHRRRKPFIIGVTMLACIASLLGFGGLISVLYPLFGYCSAAFLVTAILHYLKLRFGKKKGQMQESKTAENT